MLKKDSNTDFNLISIPIQVKIEIIAVESLGVRGLCCFIRTKERQILIDPGIALGYTRNGLLPHPFQVFRDEQIQKKIVRRWSQATDVVISHFHGDHVPLANANPYQLDIRKVTGLNPFVRIWVKKPEHLSPLEKKRSRLLSVILKKDLTPAEDKTIDGIAFSGPFPHGRKNKNPQSVMMTRIEDDESVFVHASDIQLLCDESADRVLSWKPEIVLVGGPPLYLGRRIPSALIKKAWFNARRLARSVETLILDHHLLRSREGLKWLKELSSETGKRVICGADFMDKPRLLLEAFREHLYQKMPVPPDWHEDYALGKADTSSYRETAGIICLPGANQPEH